jgi:threonine dehydrogenase-like Zn-dependent dehydrogenase
MARTGRVTVFDADRKHYEFVEYPVPEPEPGAIVLKMTMASICGSDIHTYRGDSKLAPTTAVRRQAGHEGTGQVYALGAGVLTDSSNVPLRVGDRVIFSDFSPCGHCRACLNGKDWCCPERRKQMTTSCDVWPHFRGTFGDYHYLFPGHTVFKVPDDIPDATLTGINCAMAQVTCGMDVAQVGLGDYVVIQGAGGLGIYAIAVARERGASKIIIIDGVPERLDLAAAFGPDEIIDMRELKEPDQRVARVKELTGGWGADVVIGVVGYPQVVQEGIRMVGQGGRHLEIGSIAAGNTYAADPEHWVHGNISIHGNNNWGRRHLRDAFDVLQRTRTKYPYDRIISHTFPLDQINEAVALQNQGHVTRGALVP